MVTEVNATVWYRGEGLREGSSGFSFQGKNLLPVPDCIYEMRAVD